MVRLNKAYQARFNPSILDRPAFDPPVRRSVSGALAPYWPPRVTPDRCLRQLRPPRTQRRPLTSLHADRGTIAHRSAELGPVGLRQAANHLNPETVIRCLTIATEDAPPITIAPITIALEHIMPGWPQRFLEEQIKRPTASLFGVEARP